MPKAQSVNNFEVTDRAGGDASSGLKLNQIGNALSQLTVHPASRPHWLGEANRLSAPSTCSLKRKNPGQMTRWQMQFDALVSEFGLAEIEDQPRLMARFVGLISRPVLMDHTPLDCINGIELMSLLEAGAYESLAISCVGPTMGYMQSRSPNGTCYATVWDAASRREFECQSASPAMAILGALGRAILHSRSPQSDAGIVKQEWSYN